MEIQTEVGKEASILGAFFLSECADLWALWWLVTCRQQRRDRSRRTKAVTGHRTPKVTRISTVLEY